MVKHQNLISYQESKSIMQSHVPSNLGSKLSSSTSSENGNLLTAKTAPVSTNLSLVPKITELNSDDLSSKKIRKIILFLRLSNLFNISIIALVRKSKNIHLHGRIMHVYNKRRQLMDLSIDNYKYIDGITTEDETVILKYHYEAMQATIDYEDLKQRKSDTLKELDNSCEFMVSMKRKRDCFKRFLELKYRKF